MSSSPSIAIVYDRVNKFGGAERVLLALQQLYPHSVLFTSVYDKQGASWVKKWEVRPSFLQHIPGAKTRHESFALLMPLAFESLDLSSFEMIISVTSEAAKGVITSSHQLHVCYCLTPTRYLWSHTHRYAQGIFSGIKQIAFTKLREWDYIAAQRPNVYIAISDRVKQRIEKYYRRKVQMVISPPGGDVVHVQQDDEERTYFLVVSRLVPYKDIELAIRACMDRGVPLHIVGIGSDEARLREIAKGSDSISFQGMLSDEQLAKEYEGAIALLCPQEEDFGIVSVEAQAHGVPVITRKESGVAETVLDGKTGIMFNDATVSNIAEALQRAQSTRWNRKTIRKHAEQFSTQTFLSEFRQAISDLWEKHILEYNQV